MKRKLSILLCLVLVVSAFALILVACDNNNNNPTGDEITLQVWGAEEDQAFLQDVAAAYQAANPDKKYDFLFGKQSESDAADKLLNDIETGADVFAFASDQLNKLIRGSALARLGGSVLDEIKANNTEDSVEACSVTIGGEKRTYAMPFTDNTFYLYYDKREFDVSDLATLDGILAKCSKEKQFAYPMEDSWYLSAFYFGKGLGYEVTYNDNLGEDAITCDFDCEDGLAVTNAVFSYVQDERMNPQSNDSVLVAGFKSGKIIAGASGLWNVKALKDAIGEENLGYAPLPTYTLGGEQVQMRPFAGYKCIGVNRLSANLAEAQKFALFLTNYENQVKRFETRGYSPTNKEAMNLDKIKNDACVKAIQQQLPFCKPQAGVPTTFWSPIQGLGTAMVNALGAEATPFDAQTQLTAAINQIIKAAA